MDKRDQALAGVTVSNGHQMRIPKTEQIVDLMLIASRVVRMEDRRMFILEQFSPDEFRTTWLRAGVEEGLRYSDRKIIPDVGVMFSCVMGA